MRKLNSSCQQFEACQLMKNINNASSTRQIMRDVQQCLGEKYSISLYGSTNASPTYRFGSATAEFNLNILTTGLGDRLKCSVITNLKALLAKGFICDFCGTVATKRSSHCCKSTSFCNVCKGRNCRKTPKKKIICEICGVSCSNEQCLKSHKCSRILCSECRCRYRISGKREDGSDHICREIKCVSCGLYVSETHRCYLQPLSSSDINGDDDLEFPDCNLSANENDISEEIGRNARMVFFDIESRLVNGFHQSYLVVCQIADGSDARVFYGDDSMKMFCEYFFTPAFRDYRAISFNGRNFDVYLIMRFLRSTFHRIEIVCAQGKILNLKVPDLNIELIDLVSFIPASLAQLPKLLGLKTDFLKKGFFPYAAMNNENYHIYNNYVGQLLPMELFEPQMMSNERRSEFYKFYNHKSQLNEQYNLKQEAIDYCISDVRILRLAALKFRFYFLTLSNFAFCPLEKCLTLSQASMMLYRHSHMPRETIGILPHGGLETHMRHSKESLVWLEYVMHREGIFIQHARNMTESGMGREKRVDQYHLDGFREDENGMKHAYSYLGHFHHGCPQHFPGDAFSTFHGMTYRDLYTRTIARLKELENKHGFIVHSMWSCTFDNMMKSDPKINDFAKTLHFRTPLQPRQAVYGGRCGVYRSLVEVSCYFFSAYFF